MGHDAAGSFSTGIMEAAVTSARRKIVPLNVSGITFQSGIRKKAVSKIAAQTASPSTGSVSSNAGNFRLAVTFAASAAMRMIATMKTLAPSTRKPLCGFFTTGEKPMLALRGRNRKDRERHDGRDICLQHTERADAVNPHHRRCRVADHTSSATSIGGCNDRGQIADVNLPPKDVARHRAADQRSRDVIEEARQNEDYDEKDDAAFPVIGQHGWHLIGNPTLLEVPRQNGKSHQQQEQVGQHDPLVGHVIAKAGHSRAELESGKTDLVADDHCKAGHGDHERMPVKHRNTEQHKPKEDEIERYSNDQNRIGHRILKYFNIDRVRSAQRTHAGAGESANGSLPQRISIGFASDLAACDPMLA